MSKRKLLNRIVQTGLLVGLTASVPALAQSTWVAEGPPARVTPEDQEYIQPVFSPAGDQLAVAGPQYRGIYLVDVGTPGVHTPRLLTDAPAAGYRFSWSPDGRAIVTRAARYENRRRYNSVRLYDISTGQMYMLTEEGSFMPGLPEWTLDGRNVVLPEPGGVRLLSLPSAVKVGASATVSSSREPAAVALVGDEFRAINAAGEEVERFRPVPGRYLNAVRSPDGSKIAFEVVGGDLYVANVDGGGLVNLGRGERPGWSPGSGNSSWLTYMITEDDGHQILASDIYAVRVDGTGKVNLTDSPDRIEMNPSWSPDGSTIAYDDHVDGGIYLLHVKQR